MLTKVRVRNFKLFRDVEVELGSPVLFIGPNNSGKTSALQALALWEVGLRQWVEKRKGERPPERRPGVTISRRDLTAAPVPDAKLLWRGLDVRAVGKVNGRLETKNVRIDIVVEGVTEDRRWECGLEFDYANEESFYCRPLRKSEEKVPDRMEIPEEAKRVRLVFLPPMSGLAPNETRLDPGAINVRVGEGRTAEVLRNLCFKIADEKPDRWDRLVHHIKSLFGVELEKPEYVEERGEIAMSYREGGTKLDLSSSGRGLQQTLLVLAYMYANPDSVVMLDEPDAHLEVLRQRQTYDLLARVAEENRNQIIAASHSEVLLNEAAGRDLVVAFVGRPHRMDDRGSQVLKSLTTIGFDQYLQAAQTGWVLYLEGSTDLATLRAFAERLGHTEATKALERPFVRYVLNQPQEARNHFYGIREAKPDLVGIGIFDRLDGTAVQHEGLVEITWVRREIENYLCQKEVLLAYAEATAEEAAGPLWAVSKADRRRAIMSECIDEVEEAMQTLGRGSPWDPDTKVSDDFLPPLFKKYFEKLNLPNVMSKGNYHQLARLVPKESLDPEISEKLDSVVEVSRRAHPDD